MRLMPVSSKFLIINKIPFYTTPVFGGVQNNKTMNNSELHLTDILAQIVDSKRKELAGLMTSRRSLKEALAGSATGIIAEFKRKSPSKGWIHADARPEEVVPKYAAAGAAALSILTDEPYFGGSLEFIRRVRPLVDLPILRKDFIIDPVQLVEAKQAGADAVLLIAACLSRSDCAALLVEAHRLGLEVLLEVHGPEEMDYITPDVDVVGVNNRHLGSFVTDVRTSFDLAPLMAQTLNDRGAFPPDPLRRCASTAPLRASALRRAEQELVFRQTCPKNNSCPPAGEATEEMPDQVGHDGPILISESGISDPATVRKLREAGYRGFLMGEHFMRQPDPGRALADFIDAL